MIVVRSSLIGLVVDRKAHIYPSMSALAGRIRILEGRLLENSSLLAEAEDDRDSALDRAAGAWRPLLQGVVVPLLVVGYPYLPTPPPSGSSQHLTTPPPAKQNTTF